jgi:hypothetical protein
MLRVTVLLAFVVAAMGFAPAPRTFGVNQRTVCHAEPDIEIDMSYVQKEFDKLQKDLEERIDKKAAELEAVIEKTGSEGVKEAAGN